MDKFKHKVKHFRKPKKPSKPKYTFYSTYYQNFFGDAWALTNWLLRKSEKSNTISMIKGPKSTTRMIEEIYKHLDTKGKIQITDISGQAVPDIWTIFRTEYYPTKVRWKKSNYRQICYQFVGQSFGAYPLDDVNMIFRAFRDYKLVRMGATKNNIQIASKSNLFIGIDSGMSHICHSTGTPIFMLDEKRYNPYSHPNKDLTLCKDAKDCINKVSRYLSSF